MNSIIREKKALRKQIKSILQQIPAEVLSSQGARVMRRLDQFEPFLRANRVGCYVSMASAELPTSLIIDNLIQKKKKVFLPFVSFTNQNHQITEGNNRSEGNSGETRPAFTQMDLLQFIPPSNYTSFSPLDHLVPFKFSKSSPEIFQFDPATASSLPNALDVGLDLLLLPGVGFDKNGNRLGHGKGYYDRFISSLMKQSIRETRSDEYQPVTKNGACHRTVLVGICLREQVLPSTSVPCESDHDQPLDYLIYPDGVISFSQNHHRLSSD